MTDKEKILEYLKINNISKSQFYTKTGFSNGFLDSGSSFGVDKLRIILDNYRDFDIADLLSIKQEMVKQENSHSDNNISSNISGNVKGNVVISHNDISKLIQLQQGSQEIQKELNKRLETSQEQINTLLEILKTK